MSLLYTHYKMFHYPEKLHSLTPDTPVTAPLHIRIKPTNVCNHDCYYCAYRKEGMQLGQDMNLHDYIPKEKMLEICDDIIDMGVKAVTFSGGGDPLMYPYLLEISQRLHAGGVKIAMLTNGARLHGEIAEFFAQNAMWVRISMDGWDNASYMQYRGIKDGEYTKILDNMKDFKKYNGKCLLSVVYIIDRENHHHITAMVKNLKDIGIHSVKISVCIISNDAKENNAYHAPYFSKAKAEIKKSQDLFSSKHFEIFDAFHDLDDRFTKDYTWCPYMQIQNIIAADMCVYACHDKAYNLEQGLLGSLKNQRFKDFWFTNKDKFYTINPMKVCNHHCVANCKNKMLLEYLDIDSGHVEFV